MAEGTAYEARRSIVYQVELQNVPVPEWQVRFTRYSWRGIAKCTRLDGRLCMQEQLLESDTLGAVGHRLAASHRSFCHQDFVEQHLHSGKTGAPEPFNVYESRWTATPHFLWGHMDLAQLSLEDARKRVQPLCSDPTLESPEPSGGRSQHGPERQDQRSGKRQRREASPRKGVLQVVESDDSAQHSWQDAPQESLEQEDESVESETSLDPSGTTWIHRKRNAKAAAKTKTEEPMFVRRVTAEWVSRHRPDTVKITVDDRHERGQGPWARGRPETPKDDECYQVTMTREELESSLASGELKE